MIEIKIKHKKEGKNMSKKFTFNEVKSEQFKTLGQYVPIVAKVHGKNHPEFYEVQKLFNEIIKKTNEAGTQKPELNEEFSKLREVTNSYTVPDGVCESFEAVYKMLSQADEAYQL